MATATAPDAKFEKLATELESWSIMEIAQFGKYLQERWGVSAMPVAAAAPAAGGGGGEDRVHGRPQGDRRLQDQRHQDGPRAHRFGPERSQRNG